MTKPIYTKLENGIIQRDNLDGSISFIPKDEANPDYQEYLAANEAKTK
jgi:hypothetical protein